MKNLRRLMVFAFLTFAVWLCPRPGVSQDVLPGDQAPQMVTVHNVGVEDGVVSGELVNSSKWPLSEVQLLIRYVWHWRKEFKPGEDTEGRAVYYTVEKKIPPGGKVDFTYRPAPPLPSRPDGYFETTVTVAGFAEIVQ